MEYSAIFHDMDKRFSYAVDKDLFVIRVQVKKDDMKEVILHYEDKYIPMERKDTRKTVPMKKVAVSQFHDYYEAQLKKGINPVFKSADIGLSQKTDFWR